MMHNSWSRCLMIFANPVFKQKSTTIVTQPKVKLASKFERKFDQRTFVDKKGLFDGVSFPWICDRLLHFPPISQLPTPLLFLFFFFSNKKSRINPNDRHFYCQPPILIVIYLSLRICISWSDTRLIATCQRGDTLLQHASVLMHTHTHTTRKSKTKKKNLLINVVFLDTQKCKTRSRDQQQKKLSSSWNSNEKHIHF